MDRRQTQTADPFIVEDLEQMNAAEKYNRWIFSLISPYIGSRILEVGPGIGVISRQVLDLDRVNWFLGVEPNEFCYSELQRSLSSHPQFRCTRSTIEECDLQSLQEENIDTIICVNVLEHIQDDEKIIHSFRSVLKPGGRVVLFVPAVPWAFGPMDQSVGHFRRYSPDGLRTLFRSAGLVPETIRYSNLLGLMGWIFNARVGRRVKQSNQQIRVFEALVPFLRTIESTIKIPMGMSLVAVGRNDES